MARRRLFLYLAAAAGYIGIGMIFGYLIGKGTANTPLWIGSILIVIGAILLGMGISAGGEMATVRPSSSGSPSAYPPNNKD